MGHFLRRSYFSLFKIGLESKIRTIGTNTGFYRFKQTNSSFLNRGQHRGRKKQELVEVKQSNDEDDPSTDFVQSLNDLEYESIANTTLHVSNRQIDQQIFVIQPYVKWGRLKSSTKPEHQLTEAQALIRSIPHWNVANSVKIGVDTLDKRTVFGPGQLEVFKSTINKSRNTESKISAVFVSKGMLSRQQKLNLEMEFGLPVLDRYSVVIQILRLHAISAEAKLQVAMAEIPYIWTQMRDMDGGSKGE